jgi:hypothetical protein
VEEIDATHRFQALLDVKPRHINRNNIHNTQQAYCSTICIKKIGYLV